MMDTPNPFEAQIHVVEELRQFDSDPLLASIIPTPLDTPDALWYPMRVTYGREVKMKQALDALQVPAYIPFEYRMIDSRRRLVPAISNLIFVNAIPERMRELKQMPLFEPLRYYRNMAAFDHNTGRAPILTIPSCQMDDFIRATSVLTDRVSYFRNLDYAFRPGARVRITEGCFAGITGVVKRIDGNRCVAVVIPDIAAVAIRFVPKRYLEYLDGPFSIDSSPR